MQKPRLLPHSHAFGRSPTRVHTTGEGNLKSFFPRKSVSSPSHQSSSTMAQTFLRTLTFLSAICFFLLCAVADQARNGAAEDVQDASGKVSLLKAVQNAFSLETDSVSRSSYWEKVKSVLNKGSSYLARPNPSVKASDGSKVAKEGSDEAQEKAKDSTEKMKASMQDAAKTAAKKTGEAAYKTAEKMGEAAYKAAEKMVKMPYDVAADPDKTGLGADPEL